MLFEDEVVIHLSSPGAEWRGGMADIAEEQNTVATQCRLWRDATGLHVRVEAQDDDMLGLIATAPQPGVVDQFLYEEDCVQLALAYPETAVVRDFLLANPMGKVKAAGTATGWTVTATRHAEGWVIETTIPLADDLPGVALAVHRFYRGVKNEVHGLTATLPHPLDPEEFALVLLQARASADKLYQGIRKAKEAHLSTQIARARARLAARKPLPAPWLDLAKEFALTRAETPLNADARFLCWNEGHYQHALLNLWELTRERRWLEIAVERMDGVWALTGERLIALDGVWGVPRPTWYTEGDELGAAISLITGVIIYPMARLLRAVWTDPALADLRARVEPWVPPLRRAIAEHDVEWVELPEGSGAYLEPYVKGPRRVYPSGGSRICPLNRMFFLAMPMLILGRLLGNDVYLDRVRRMAVFFRDALEETEHGAYVWEYESGYYPAMGEDISHAACQVDFAEWCAREGIEIDQDDLRSIALTLSEHIFVHGDVPCGEVRGLTPDIDMAVGAWSSLTRFAPEILPRIEAVIETAYTERPEFFPREGWGIRLLTLVEQARRRMG